MINKNRPELLIKELEFRYQRLFETAQDGILILDASTEKIIDVNPFLEKLLGYSKKEFLGKNLWELQAIKNIEDNKIKFKKLQKENYVRYEDLPLRTKDDRLIDVEFVSNVYKVGVKKIIQCNIRDITERKQAEVKLELEVAKREAILSSVGDGIIATEVDGRIITMNIAAQKILGWNIQEIIGGLLSEIIIIEDENEKSVPLNVRNPIITNGFYIGRDKVKVPIAVNIKPIFWVGKMIGMVIVFRDRSKEVEVEKIKKDILLQIIHDLRAPSSAIRLAAEIYSDPKYIAKDEDSLIKGVKLIQEANLRMINLINSLLKNTEKQDNLGKIEQINIDVIFKNIIKEVNLAAQQKKVKITYNSLNKVLKMDAISIKIQEIFSNIIDNAIKYNKVGGQIIISNKIDNNHLKIIIKDTGLGISDEDLKKIFTPYFRASNKKNIQGTGLGLYITKKLIEDMGGKIEIKSKLKIGTTFTIYLPIKNFKN